MQAPDYRYQVFAKVFGNPDGQMVLAYLEQVYRIGTPDFECPNNVYYRLGRQSVIGHIRNILNYNSENGGKNE
jgi:hypothetical protein